MTHNNLVLRTRRLFAGATVALFGLLATASAVHAANFTWDGGGADTNATTVLNWVGDAANFTSGDTLIFDSSSGAAAVVFNSTFATSGLNLYVASNFAGSGITMSTTSITFASSTYADSDTTLTLGSNTMKFTGDAVWTNGTLSAGSGTLDFNGKFRIDGGTVTIGATTAASDFLLGGTFTHAAGTTLTFDGNVDQLFTTASSTLVNLTIANTGATSSIEVKTSGNLRVANLTLTDGHLDIGTNNSTLYITGDVSADNTNGAFTNVGTGSVVWMGTGTQLIDSQAGDVGGGIITWGACKFSGAGTFRPTTGSTVDCNDITVDQGTFDPRTNSVAVKALGNFIITNGATYSSTTASLSLRGFSAKNLTDNTIAALGSKQDLGFVIITNTGGVSTTTSTRFTSFVIDSGATLDITGDKILTASSTPFSVNGTLTDTAASGYEFVGSMNQNIPARVYQGPMTLGSNVTYTVTASTTVVGAFTKTNGVLSLGSSQLHVTGTYTNSGGTVNEGTGKVKNTVQSVKITNSSGTETAAFATATDPVFIRVAESDANTNASVAETMTVSFSTNGGVVNDEETITLTETGVATGIFMSAPLQWVPATAGAKQDGYIQFNGTGNLALSFTDAQDTTDTGSDTATYAGESIKSITTPAAVGLYVNGEDKETKSIDVTLYIPTNRGVNSMLVSNDANFSGAVWEPYALYKKWKLNSGNGKKTVYVKVEGYDGLQSKVASDDITLAVPAATTETKTPDTTGTTDIKKPTVAPKESTTPQPESVQQPVQTTAPAEAYTCPERSSATTIDNGRFIKHVAKEKVKVGKRTVTRTITHYYLVLDDLGVMCPVKDTKTVTTWTKKKVPEVKTLPEYTKSTVLPPKPKSAPKKKAAYQKALEKFRTAVKSSPRKKPATRLGLQ